jgi:two-component system, NtrC family, response regulator AtoC
MKQERTLLIVDDEENMRHMLQALVGRHGYTVETAVDGWMI